MRTPRLLTLLVALLLVGLPAGLVAGTASAATPTELSLKALVKKGVYHDSTNGKLAASDVTGYQVRLTTSSGAAVPNAPLVLERKLAGESDWTEIEGRYTDGAGRTRLYDYVAGNATYRVQFAGDATYGAATSKTAKLKAMRDLNGKTVQKGPRKIVFKGDVNPGWGKKAIRLQKKACGSCGWKSAKKKKTTAHGGWKFQVTGPPQIGKSWKFRAKIGAGGQFTTSTSVVLKVTTVRARSLAGSSHVVTLVR